MKRRTCFLSIPALLCMPRFGWSAEVAAPLLTIDPQGLADTRHRLLAGDKQLASAYAALKARAAKALDAPLRSVVDKTMTPPSGSRNDYMSMGPYWWPNPASANGLPYVRRDGHRNPQVAGDALDAERMQAMGRDIFELTLAHHFGADDRHAEKAVSALRHWFLEPATAMHPHLRFGQGIPGIVEGRAEGLIDTRNLWMVIDAALLLRAHGALSEADLTALRQWFSEFTRWMRTSPTARAEDAAENNHGTFFDMQFVNYLLFAGEEAAAKERLSTVAARRFARQIEPDGRMPRELARTKPFHYSAFNLEAMTHLAQYGRLQGVDLWGDERLQHAIAWLQGMALTPAEWTKSTSTEPHPEPEKMLSTLLMARQALGKPQPLLEPLFKQNADAVDWLLWPMPAGGESH
ncbi:MAG TPA: alginate lyase family protein [Burkholderiaceae bacterium]|jgi:hypothetical protein